MALAAILLIDPENGDREGFCSSLCKFSISNSNALTGRAHVIIWLWTLWRKIGAIQTIKIRSQRRGTSHCEGGTYFTHRVVICQAFAPNYSNLISKCTLDVCCMVPTAWCLWWRNWLWLTLFMAFQGRGRAAGAAGTAIIIGSRAEVSQPTSCFLKVSLWRTGDNLDFRDMSRTVTKTSSVMLTGSRIPSQMWWRNTGYIHVKVIGSWETRLNVPVAVRSC